MDSDAVLRLVSIVTAVLEQRERRFFEEGIDSMTAFRHRRDTGELIDNTPADVFLVIDG